MKKKRQDYYNSSIKPLYNSLLLKERFKTKVARAESEIQPALSKQEETISEGEHREGFDQFELDFSCHSPISQTTKLDYSACDESRKIRNQEHKIKVVDMAGNSYRTQSDPTRDYEGSNKTTFVGSGRNTSEGLYRSAGNMHSQSVLEEFGDDTSSQPCLEEQRPFLRGQPIREISYQKVLGKRCEQMATL